MIDFLSAVKHAPVLATLVGQRIKTKDLEKSTPLASAPLTIRAGQAGVAIILKYGVIVTFNLTPVEHAKFLEDMANYIEKPYENPVLEEHEIFCDKDEADGFSKDLIRIKQWDCDRLQVIADVLAKSVFLSYHEDQISQTFDRLDPIAEDLQNGKVTGKHSREFVKLIGATLAIQRRMIGHVAIEDKPDVLWDNSEHERFYLRLEDEYELKERASALKEKLQLIHQTAETINGLLSEKRTLHVEWYITILIVIEIILGLSGVFGH